MTGGIRLSMCRVPDEQGAPLTIAEGGSLGDKQTRLIQHCFILPGPPNFGESLQNLHSPQSVALQALHVRHRRFRGALFDEAFLAFFFGGGAGGGASTTTGLQTKAFSPSTRHRSNRGTSMRTVSDWHLQCDACLPISAHVSVAKFVDSATLYPWLNPQ